MRFVKYIATEVNGAETNRTYLIPATSIMAEVPGDVAEVRAGDLRLKLKYSSKTEYSWVDRGIDVTVIKENNAQVNKAITLPESNIFYVLSGTYTTILSKSDINGSETRYTILESIDDIIGQMTTAVGATLSLEPEHIAYADSNGNITGDDLATRNETTGITKIKRQFEADYTVYQATIGYLMPITVTFGTFSVGDNIEAMGGATGTITAIEPADNESGYFAIVNVTSGAFSTNEPIVNLTAAGSGTTGSASWASNWSVGMQVQIAHLSDLTTITKLARIIAINENVLTLISAIPVIDGDVIVDMVFPSLSISGVVSVLEDILTVPYVVGFEANEVTISGNNVSGAFLVITDGETSCYIGTVISSLAEALPLSVISSFSEISPVSSSEITGHNTIYKQIYNTETNDYGRIYMTDVVTQIGVNETGFASAKIGGQMQVYWFYNNNLFILPNYAPLNTDYVLGVSEVSGGYVVLDWVTKGGGGGGGGGSILIGDVTPVVAEASPTVDNIYIQVEGGGSKSIVSIWIADGSEWDETPLTQSAGATVTVSNATPASPPAGSNDVYLQTSDATNTEVDTIWVDDTAGGWNPTYMGVPVDTWANWNVKKTNGTLPKGKDIFISDGGLAQQSIGIRAKTTIYGDGIENLAVGYFKNPDYFTIGQDVSTDPNYSDVLGEYGVAPNFNKGVWAYSKEERVITISNIVGGSWVVGNPVTFVGSGATGSIVADNGGTITVVKTSLTDILVTDTIDNGAGVTADIDSIASHPYENGDIVIEYNATQYVVKDKTKTNGQAPSLNADAYQLLSKANGLKLGYRDACDEITYDFENNQIISRTSVLQVGSDAQKTSIINGYYNIMSYPFGNPKVSVICLDAQSSVYIECSNDPTITLTLFKSSFSSYYGSGTVIADLSNSSYYEERNHGFVRVKFMGYSCNIEDNAVGSTIAITGTLSYEENYGYGVVQVFNNTGDIQNVNLVNGQFQVFDNSGQFGGIVAIGTTAGINSTGNAGTVQLLTLINGGVNIALNNGIQWYSCSVVQSGLTAIPTITQNGRYCTATESTFMATVDVTGLAVLDLTTLNGGIYNMYGQLTLTSSNLTETIHTIKRGSAVLPRMRIQVVGMTSITFTGTAYGSITAGKLVMDVANITLLSNTPQFMDIESPVGAVANWVVNYKNYI